MLPLRPPSKLDPAQGGMSKDSPLPSPTSPAPVTGPSLAGDPFLHLCRFAALSRDPAAGTDPGVQCCCVKLFHKPLDVGGCPDPNTWGHPLRTGWRQSGPFHKGRPYWNGQAAARDLRLAHLRVSDFCTTQLSKLSPLATMWGSALVLYLPSQPAIVGTLHFEAARAGAWRRGTPS
jgi:hypothetical protein